MLAGHGAQRHPHRLRRLQAGAARSAQEHIADCLQRLNAREIDIYAEWEKSKGERIETHAENRNGSSTAKLKKKQAYGDPWLAVLLLQCWAHILLLDNGIA